MRNDQFALGAVRDVASGQVLAGTDLDATIAKRANVLRAEGLTAGSGVFLYQQNCIDFFVNLLAAWRLEACVVPLDPQLPPASRQRLERAYAPALCIDADGSRRSAAGKQRWPEDAALVLLTSGSTGVPKGILHSGAAVRAKLAALRQAIPLDDLNIAFCALPTSFGHGLVCNALLPLLSGQQLLIAPVFSAALVAELDALLVRYGATFMSSTPLVWSMVDTLAAPRQKPTLRRLHCASAPLTVRHLEVMRRWSPESECFNVYGLTEMLGWIAGVPADAGALDCVGRPWSVDTRLVPERSELEVRAAFQLRGIVDIEPRTRVQDVAAGDWVATGDVARLLDDGRIVLGGRLDFVINKGGFKIQPAEIESVSLQNSSVGEACCVAFADPLWGQKVGLAIVRRGSETFSLQSLQQHLRATLAPQKLPDRIIEVAALPRNARGKIDRQRLSDELQRA